MIRTRLLPACLILVTGYTAPAVAQGVFLDAMIHAGANSGESGELGDPICCNYRDIGRPDLVTAEMALACGRTPEQLFRGVAASLPPGSVVPDRRVPTGPFSLWPFLGWNGEGELIMAGVTMTDNDGWWRQGVGEWSNAPGIRGNYQTAEPIPDQPTLAEWYAGEPISVNCGPDIDPQWLQRPDLFEAVYGFHPLNARVQVRFYWVEDLWIQDIDKTLGGRIRVEAFPFEGSMFAAGDWNRDGAVGVPDLFDFLGAFFRDDPRAGLCDGCGGCAATDIFAFLTCWFGGQ